MTFCLSILVLMLLASGKEDSSFLNAKEPARVLQTYTDAQLQQSPYPGTGWANNIINYKSNWPLNFLPATFDGQDCTSVANAWNFESYYVNDGFIWSTVAQRYLALRLIGQSYQLTAETTLDQTAQQWTIENPSNTIPFPYGFVHITQVRNGVTYALAQLIHPPDNGVLLTATSTLPVGVVVLPSGDADPAKLWNFHASGTLPSANYPLCSVNIQGYLKDSTTNNLISSTVLATNPSVTFTGNQKTYSATINPATSIYSITLPPGTYTLSATVSQYQPTSGSMTFLQSSQFTQGSNTIFMVSSIISVVISGYLKDETNQNFDSISLSAKNPTVTFYASGQYFTATVDLSTSIYSITLPVGTYSRVVTMKGCFPQNTTVTVSGNSDQTSNFNSISLEAAVWTVYFYWNSNLAWVLGPAAWEPDGQEVSAGNLQTSVMTYNNNGGPSYQPQFIVFHDLYTMPGTYNVVVSQSSLTSVPLAQSEAYVTLYKGDKQGGTLVKTINIQDIPTQSNEWHVFDFNVSPNDDESYTVINTFY